MENEPFEKKESKQYEFFNGFGGFINDGKEYEILLEGDNKPPAPWINVVSNKNFGFQISEAGAGFTWAHNSRENKITSWSNDPVSDRPSEAIYILDEVTGELWSPVSQGRQDLGKYLVRHGFGYSKFLHEEEGVESELTVFVPIDEPVKLWRLNLTNQTEHTKYFRLSYYAEWVLGTAREHTNPYILTAYDNEHEVFMAKNIYTFQFQNNQAFLFSNEMINGYTGDRREFFGVRGSYLSPEGVDAKLSSHTGAGYDSCGVIQVSVAVPPKEKKEIIFGLGYSDDINEIRKIRYKYKDLAKVESETIRLQKYWDKVLGVIKVKTSDPAIDIMVNGWLIYQTIACRINARTAFYQCGGAYGYRDQLQDTLSLTFTDPEALRKQIIIACSRQFEEGDVQHWWHPPTGVGVRTRITDDLLWLPYAVAAYIRSTGDEGILSEEVAYIKGPVLEPHQHEVMFTPEVSQLSESVYEHCKKTIQITRHGEHGLPLMGGGDWNDGMNEVGKDGKGESVWLAWFFYTVLGEFIPLCHRQQEPEYARELEERRDALLKSIEANAWDGEWYLRAYYDDGTKMGSKESDECKIDSISQSWSVISGGGKKERTITAMQSAWRYLIREEESISLLLTPPFDKTPKNPGYIKNYIPGIRENGGQYTHAAVWLAIATAKLGDYAMAHKLFSMLNPIHITANRKDSLRYEKEPYVMIADISLSPPYTGRGGWSWYTGSAGWMYQGLVQWFLGLRKEGNQLVIQPSTPAGFGEYSLEYKFGESIYFIKVVGRSRGSMEIDSILVDEVKVKGNRIDLIDDKKEHVIVV